MIKGVMSPPASMNAKGSCGIYCEDGDIWINRNVKGFDITFKGVYELDSHNLNNFLITVKGNRVIGVSLGATITSGTPFLKYGGNPKVVKGMFINSDNMIEPINLKKIH